MLDKDNLDQIKGEVVQAYENRCNWTGVSVTEVIENKILGILVAIKANQSPEGEICLYRPGGVMIFDTTPELVRYLDAKAARLITYKEILVGIIVVSMIVIFGGVVFYLEADGAVGLVTTAMSGILGTFVGVRLGNDRDRA